MNTRSDNISTDRAFDVLAENYEHKIKIRDNMINELKMEVAYLKEKNNDSLINKMRNIGETLSNEEKVKYWAAYQECQKKI